MRVLCQIGTMLFDSCEKIAPSFQLWSFSDISFINNKNRLVFGTE